MTLRYCEVIRYTKMNFIFIESEFNLHCLLNIQMKTKFYKLRNATHYSVQQNSDIVENVPASPKLP